MEGLGPTAPNPWFCDCGTELPELEFEAERYRVPTLLILALDEMAACSVNRKVASRGCSKDTKLEFVWRHGNETCLTVDKDILDEGNLYLEETVSVRGAEHGLGPNA